MYHIAITVTAARRNPWAQRCVFYRRKKTAAPEGSGGPEV